MFVQKANGDFFEYVAVVSLKQTGFADGATKFPYTATLSDGTTKQLC